MFLFRRRGGRQRYGAPRVHQAEEKDGEDRYREEQYRNIGEPQGNDPPRLAARPEMQAREAGEHEAGPEGAADERADDRRNAAHEGEGETGEEAEDRIAVHA